MKDPRALRNSKNLESYRAWDREGYRRSGFFWITLIAPLLVPFFTLGATLLEHTTRDARAWVVLVGAAFAIYLAACLGLSLVAVLRLNAWKRAHPWTPPPARASVMDRWAEVQASVRSSSTS